jgi:hypothetical protein
MNAKSIGQFLLKLLGTGVFAGGFALAIIWLLPQTLRGHLTEIKISAKEASLRFESGPVRGAILYIPAQGGSRQTPWVDTKYPIEKGDIIHLTASGRVHTDIYKLVADARADTALAEPWATPAGVDATELATVSCQPLLVAPGAPFAALIGAIQSPANEIPEPFFLGAESTIKAPQKGTLLLTINDIWLRPEGRNRYAHLDDADTPEKITGRSLIKMHTDAKIEMLWHANTLPSLTTPSQKELDDRARRMIKNRFVYFSTLIENQDFDLWYRDNVGGYVVALEVEKCRGERCSLDAPKSAANCAPAGGGAPGPR